MEKEQQKKLLTEIMEADQKNGLYEHHHIGDTNKMVTMKLYTEEEVFKAIQMADKYHYLITSEECDIVNSLTPIELPSDEEIKKETPFFYTEWGDGFFEGATYLRDLIQGGNK